MAPRPEDETVYKQTIRAKARSSKYFKKLGMKRLQTRDQAKAIVALQTREAAVRMATQENATDEQIARFLGCRPRTVKKYRLQAVKRLQAQEERRKSTVWFMPAYDPLDPLESLRPYRSQSVNGYTAPGADDANSRATPRALSAPNDGSSEHARPGGSSSQSASGGELLPPPDVIQLRKDCLHLRKAMLPFDQIASLLGISENDAKRHTADAIHELQRSELMNADMQRTLMLEQIDQMIAAIHAPATGRDIGGKPGPVELHAIDRMLKLMRQKADLLGIGEPPAVDIRIKLQQLAYEGGYDILDLEDIARGVLQDHKTRVPEFK